MVSSKKQSVVAGTGMSTAKDAYTAGKEAAQNALEDLRKRGGDKPIFGLVFSSAAAYAKKQKDIENLAKGANEVFLAHNPECKWVGSTSRAEISNFGYTENSVVVMALSSDYVRFGVGVGEGADKKPRDAGRRAAEIAVNDVKIDKYLDPYFHFLAMKNKDVKELLKMKPYFLMTLFPGATKTYLPQDNEIIQGIESVTGVQPLFGGDAGEDWSLTQTYTMANGKVYSTGVIVVSIVSDVKMNLGVAHGYERDGGIVVATKVKGNVVYEINGKPAAQVYAAATKTSVDQLKQAFLPIMADHPFGIPDIDGNFWINCPYGVGDKDSILFFEPIKEGAAMCIMKADERSVIESAEVAIKRSTESMEDLAALIIFSCSCRILHLKQAIVKEVETVKKVTKGKPFIGLYTYAEHAMLPTGSVYKHGITFVCGAISNAQINK